MNLATLDISPDEIKERLAAYEGVLQENRTAEDVALLSAYRAADRGLPIISLPQVIAAGGWFPNSGLPRLAIVRADTRECFVQVDRWGGRARIRFSNQRWPRDFLSVSRHSVRLNLENNYSGTVLNHAQTVVPLVPPQHRPKRGRLGNFHILWEVERWDPTPPRDPALLRHIRGDLWSVLAVWDLTELERAVLSERIQDT